MSPVVISVTALGEQVASELEYDHETVRDEVQHLRDQHRQLIEGVSHLQDTYDELEEQVDEIDMSVEKNATDIQGVKRFLDDRFDVS
jgi:predicted nuclease with TOPRIM domain